MVKFRYPRSLLRVFEELDIECLNPLECRNQNTRLRWVCKSCGREFIRTPVSLLRTRSRVCKMCSDRLRGRGNATSVGEVRRRLDCCGVKVKSLVPYEKRMSTKVKLSFICQRCGREYVSRLSTVMYRCQRVCRKCSYLDVSRTQINSSKERVLSGVYDWAKRRGVLYLFDEGEYSLGLLTFRCAMDGCNNTKTVTKDYVRSNDYNLPFYCDEHMYLNIKRGESHPWYNASMSESLRRYYSEANPFRSMWYQLVRRVYGFESIDNGKNGDLSVHHVRQVNQCPELRYSVLNGVLVSRGLHMEFHKSENGGLSGGYKELRDFFIRRRLNVGGLDHLEELSKTLKIEMVTPDLIDGDGGYVLRSKKECADRGVRYIPVWFHALSNRELARKIGESLRYMVWGHDVLDGCDVEVRLLNSLDVRRFVGDYYRGGVVIGSVNIGLVDGRGLGKIVMVASFGKSRMGRKYGKWELYRLVTKSDVCIRGGLSKLLSRLYGLTGIDSFVVCCDRDWSDWDYRKVGFYKAGMECVDVVPSSCLYMDDSGDVVYTADQFSRGGMRSLFARGLLDRYDESMSEDRVAEENGLIKVFDCGRYIFRWSREG